MLTAYGDDIHTQDQIYTLPRKAVCFHKNQRNRRSNSSFYNSVRRRPLKAAGYLFVRGTDWISFTAGRRGVCKVKCPGVGRLRVVVVSVLVDESRQLTS